MGGGALTRAGGEGRESGWAKGWSKEARDAAAELANSTAAHVITAFLDPVRGHFNPPAHVDAAAYVRRLGHELAKFDGAALRAAADVMTEGGPGIPRRKRDLPDVGEIVERAKAHKRHKASGPAADAPPADAAVAARLPEVLEALANVVGIEAVNAWCEDLQLEKVAGRRLTVSVTRKHCRTWLEQQLGLDLQWAARRVFPDVQDVEVTLRGQERRAGQ